MEDGSRGAKIGMLGFRRSQTSNSIDEIDQIKKI
jgi:hypothetical protein